VRHHHSQYNNTTVRRDNRKARQ